MMKRIAMAAIRPASGLISWRAIVASDAPFAPRRSPQRDHVVHGAGEADARDEPEQSGHEAELRGQHRPDERTRTRDRREVVAEQHPPRRDVIVVAVSLRVRRRDVPVVERHHLRGEERAVVAVGQDQARQGRQNDVRRSHGRDSNRSVSVPSTYSSPFAAASARSASDASRNSPSHFETTTVARQLPMTFVIVRAMSMIASTPRIVVTPSSGRL